MIRNEEAGNLYICEMFVVAMNKQKLFVTPKRMN